VLLLQHIFIHSNLFRITHVLKTKNTKDSIPSLGAGNELSWQVKTESELAVERRRKQKHANVSEAISVHTTSLETAEKSRTAQ